MIWGGADVIIIEIKLPINIVLLNHPETIPHQVCGKIISHKTCLWCQKCWGPLNTVLQITAISDVSGFLLLQTILCEHSYNQRLAHFFCERIFYILWPNMVSIWRRKWQPTPIFLPGESPGESPGQRSLVGYSPRCPRVGQDLAIKQQWSLSNILLYFEIKFKIWKKGKVILKTVK